MEQTRWFAMVAAITGVLILGGLWIHKHEADIYFGAGRDAMRSIDSILANQDSLRAIIAIAHWEHTSSQLDSLANEVHIIKGAVDSLTTKEK